MKSWDKYKAGTLVEQFDAAVTDKMSEIAPHCVRRGVADIANEDATTVIFDCSGAERPLRIKASGLDLRVNSGRIKEFGETRAYEAWRQFVVSGDDQKPEDGI